MDSTVVVAVTGVAGTLLAGLGAPILAAKRSDASRLRDERVQFYTDALRHFADLRQRFFTDWFQGAPPGGKVTPPPQDEVTARMTLLAPWQCGRRGTTSWRPSDHSTPGLHLSTAETRTRARHVL